MSSETGEEWSSRIKCREGLCVGKTVVGVYRWSRAMQEAHRGTDEGGVDTCRRDKTMMEVLEKGFAYPHRSEGMEGSVVEGTGDVLWTMKVLLRELSLEPGEEHMVESRENLEALQNMLNMLRHLRRQMGEEVDNTQEEPMLDIEWTRD